MTDGPLPDPYRRRRVSVEAFLRERSVVLAELYAFAGDLVEDRRPSGWPHLVSHVGRDLMNRLADHVVAVPLSDPDTPTLRPPAIAQRLREVLDADDQTLRDVARGLVDEIACGSEATAQRAAALVAEAEAGHEADEAAAEAWVSAWRGLQQRFASWAHLQGPGAREVDQDACENAWRELTDLIATRVAQEPFFESLDELLEIASAPAPASQEQARSALARLRPGTKERFYAELIDARWVERLAEQGMFNHPPPAIRQDDTIRFPGWPEGHVLVRFAATAPDSVARAARAVPSSDNARVANALATVAAELPAALAADSGLVARVISDLGGSARLLDIADPAGKLAQRLAIGGRMTKALAILEALLRIEYTAVEYHSDFIPDGIHGNYRHEEYLVDQATRAMLAALVTAGARTTIKTLTRLLARAQGRLSYEDSTAWRDAVAGTNSPHGNDSRHLLLELLRDACATDVMAGASEAAWVLQHLAQQQSTIFERLRLHLLVEAPDQAATRQATLTTPETLFGRDQLPEIYRLVPVGFAEMDSSGKAHLLALIENGPAQNLLRLPREEIDSRPEALAAWQDEWRQRLLTALEPALPPGSVAVLHELRSRRGRIDRPDFAGSFAISSWTGPTSPRTAAELAALNEDDLIDLLRDYRAERHFAAPTPAGLARELAQATQSDPDRWIWLAARLGELPADYARAWMSGLQMAVREYASLPQMDRVLDALEWVIEQPGDPTDSGTPLAAPTSYFAAKLAAAHLLIDILSRDGVDLGQREQVWILVRALVDDPDPTLEREGTTEAEPMHLAPSTIRSCGATAVVRYLQWLDRRLPDGDGPGHVGFNAAPEARSVLQHALTADPSAAVRAALAAELPILAAVDQEWLTQRIASVADPSGNELARVGWTTYLSYAHLTSRAANALADAYQRAVGGLADAGPELDGDRRHLADHVAVIWRDIPGSVPGLLDDFLAVAPDADCARVIATLGRALHTNGPSQYQPSPDDVTRHRALWQTRLDDTPGPLELHDFGSWWSSGRFASPDDLARVANTLRRANGHLADIRRALAMTAQLADADPTIIEPVLELVEALTGTRAAQGQYIQADILARLLEPPLAQPHLRERAIGIVHALGEQGYLTLRSLLD
jgi:hypothetical protein